MIYITICRGTTLLQTLARLIGQQTIGFFKFLRDDYSYATRWLFVCLHPRLCHEIR